MKNKFIMVFDSLDGFRTDDDAISEAKTYCADMDIDTVYICKAVAVVKKTEKISVKKLK